MDSAEQPPAPDARLRACTTVTPLSKYLAMTLFVALPFIGGWVGYWIGQQNTPGYQQSQEESMENVVVKDVQTQEVRIENDVETIATPTSTISTSTPDYEWPLISRSTRQSMQEIDFENPTCDHSPLNTISEDMYANWPVYAIDEFGISFSYPPQQQPNVTEKYTDSDGVERFRVGYDPNRTPEFAGYGRPYLHNINDTWQIEVHEAKENEDRLNNNFCKDAFWWCRLEALDHNNGFNTYVYSYEIVGMVDIEKRGYHIYSNDGMVIDLSLPAATGGGDACEVIPEIYNLDIIAHSLRSN